MELAGEDQQEEEEEPEQGVHAEGTSGATEHDVRPVPWEHMSGADQWWLRRLWDGDLQAEVDRSRTAHGGTGQANVVFDLESA